MTDNQTFNYHASSKFDHFKSWFLLNVLLKAFGTVSLDEEGPWKEISDASNKFTEVEFEFKVNGVPIPDPLSFLDTIESQMEHMIQVAAKEMLEEQTSEEMSRLTEQVDQFVNLIEARFRKIALEQNVDTTKEYWKDKLL